jgi:hypothetical protein
VTANPVDSATATLRDFLDERFSDYRQHHTQLNAAGRAAFAVLLTAAFRKAATRRFSADSPPETIIRFVAEARAQYTTTGELVAAEDAEKVIRAALGEEHLVDDMDGRRFGSAQTAMLFALTHDTPEARGSIDSLMADAAKETETYLAQKRTAP